VVWREGIGGRDESGRKSGRWEKAERRMLMGVKGMRE